MCSSDPQAPLGAVVAGEAGEAPRWIVLPEEDYPGLYALRARAAWLFEASRR